MKLSRPSLLLFSLAPAVVVLMSLLASGGSKEPGEESPLPLKALLIAGGCCHDYEKQHLALSNGIQKRAKVRVDVMWTRDKSTNPPLPVYDDPDWAKGYDVVIHHECAASHRNPETIKHILDAHKTVPAVHLHCAMHSFKPMGKEWGKHLGLQSTGHGPQEPIEVAFVDQKHPITAPLKDWVTKKEELYNNHEVFDAHPLALGHQKTKSGEQSAIVVWTNETQGAPSFSTTLGHNTYTIEDPRFLDLVTRGLLWTCGKLNEDYLQSYTGSNVITEMIGEKEQPANVFGDPPKGATMVKVSAKSVQESDGHYPWKAIDRDEKTRWTANGASHPSWWQAEFQEPTTVTSAEILWEKRNQWYQYKIESSQDGENWQMVYDGSANERRTDTKDQFRAEKVKFLRVTQLNQESDMWPAFWEIRLGGENGPLKLHPILDEKAQRQARSVGGKGLEKSGNIEPKIAELSAAEEAEILKDAEVPEGFEKTLFASWRSANYPVYIAASPEGDLYVASDGNGSLGREPGRGRVMRLRDTDGDGRADEVTQFIREIDSPRGLIWDHERLYLLHPPHISVFFDRDHDGIAEESKRLISDIAFGFKDRPADHTTNGLEMGIDGWIYVAAGDFGFMKATGSDGRTLQHRGGGVLRFRPDGSGLEIFATGTRNILGTPMSPTLDLFARDNTNDGGGWDVRFHHFTPMGDHGYPRLYKNWEKEAIAPLADYGGGSGCGSVYIHEPGFPEEWNKAPFTCDWGRAGLFRHSVEPHGATFKETTSPQRFIKVSRPTDADVDGMSAVYQAAWKGPATFKWAGPDQGYIVRVTPKGFTPERYTNPFKLNLTNAAFTLNSPSHIRTLAAQRRLLRADYHPKAVQILTSHIFNPKTRPGVKIAALFVIASWKETMALDLIESENFPSEIQDIATRVLGDFSKSQSDRIHQSLKSRLNSEDPTIINEAIFASARHAVHGKEMARHLAHEDPIIRHTAYRALAKMSAHEAAFSMIDSDNIDTRKAAAWALMRMHKKEVIDGLLARLTSEKKLSKRRPLLSVLARLYHTEAEWKGDSWGTRPDTRGPYYQLATWEESPRILENLRRLLRAAENEEATFIIEKLTKNRIPTNDALNRILELAQKDAKLIPSAISQLAQSSAIPPEAYPLVLKGLANPKTPPGALADGVLVLTKSDHPEALLATISALIKLKKTKGAGKEFGAALKAYRSSPKLENLHLPLEEITVKDPRSNEAFWANVGLISLASKKGGSPEAREMSKKHLEKFWADSQHRLTIIEALTELRNPLMNDRIALALQDPDSEIAEAAEAAARRLKIQAPGVDKTPKVATLSPEKAIAAITRHQGDAALGQAIYTRATCNACHTVSQDEAQKGPYLGNIAETYRRKDLIEAILVPGKTIAQGFATNMVTLKDGKTHIGFVTDEAGDSVTMRDIASNETTFKKSAIKTRTTLPNSLMPPGLMSGFTIHETASLIDYLESLVKK
ncbi:MAG: DUF7133 domain-containing protein [Akkermansiaceae bacterium]